MLSPIWSRADRTAAINFNNVWAAQGIPVDQIKAHEREGDTTGFHIGGSDASGIVYTVGSAVTSVKVGDRIVVHLGYWDEDDPFIKADEDPHRRVSSEAKFDFCLKLGAKGCINRKKFEHWGMLPHWTAARPPGRHQLHSGPSSSAWGHRGGAGCLRPGTSRTAEGCGGD